jgi:hypothetical protein
MLGLMILVRDPKEIEVSLTKLMFVEKRVLSSENCYLRKFYIVSLCPSQSNCRNL